MLQQLRHCWHLIRRISGDDAYEQYLKHYAEFHASSVDVQPPLSRKEFAKFYQEAKWKGVNRCC